MDTTERHTITIYKGTGFFSSSVVGTVDIVKKTPFVYKYDEYSAKICRGTGMFSSHIIGEILPFQIDADSSDYVSDEPVYIPTGKSLFNTRQIAGYASSFGTIRTSNNIIGECEKYSKTIKNFRNSKEVGKYSYSKSKWNADDLSEDLITFFATAGALLLLSVELNA